MAETSQVCLPQVDAEGFWRDGYTTIKGAFSADYVIKLREAAIAQQKSGDTQGDLLNSSQDILRDLVTHPVLLHCASTLLEDVPVYFGDSSITYGSFHRGWHKDNRFPDRFKHFTADWSGRHTMLRFGIYLQNHTQYSGGLSVRSGSNRPSKLVNKLEKLKIPVIDKLKNERIKTRLQIIASRHYGAAKVLDSDLGDLLIWNQVTTHSGNALRLKICPRKKLPTWIENHVPEMFVKPYEKDRISIFLAYAKDDEHLKRGLEFLKTRDYMQRKWEIYKQRRYKSSSDLRILNYQDIK